MDSTGHNTKEILRLHRNHNGNIGYLKLLLGILEPGLREFCSSVWKLW